MMLSFYSLLHFEKVDSGVAGDDQDLVHGRDRLSLIFFVGYAAVEPLIRVGAVDVNTWTERCCLRAINDFCCKVLPADQRRVPASCVEPLVSKRSRIGYADKLVWVDKD